MKPHTLFALLIYFSGNSLAQPVLTFNDALSSTWANHPVLFGKRSAHTAAQADLKGAEWQRYPTPRVEATTEGNSRNNNSMVRLDQPLWTGGRITSSIDSATSRLSAADAVVEIAKQDMAYRVIAAYVDVLRGKAKLRYMQSSVTEHENLLAMIQRRAKHEVSSRTDQRLAETRLYQAVNDLASTKLSYNNAIAQLSQLCVCSVTDVSDNGISIPPVFPSLRIVVMESLAFSPLLRRLKHEEEVAEADIQYKRSAYMPQFALRLEKNTGLISDTRAMVVLQIQPGAGLSSLTSVDAAIARREAVRMEREAAEREVEEKSVMDWNEWVSSMERLENSNHSRRMAIEVSESYKRQYVVGRKSWIDVMNAAREATSSELAIEDVRAQLIASGLRLRAHTGKLDMTETPKSR